MKLKYPKYYVYAHINKKNFHVYIGITQNIKNRWAGNGKSYKSCRKFYNAILKYGWDNFEHVILINSVNRKFACQMERVLIALFKSQNMCYNISEGGEGNYGVQHTDTFKANVSARFKGVPKSAEHRLKISIGNKGKPKSKEASMKSGKSRSLNYRNNSGYKLLCIRDGVIIKVYNTIVEAAEDTGALVTHINRCLKGLRKHTRGYSWKKLTMTEYDTFNRNSKLSDIGSS